MRIARVRAGRARGYDAAMRLLFMLCVALLLLSTSCKGLANKAQPPCDPPKTGQVLAACDPTGSIVVSLGVKDGVRPGDTLLIMRGTQPVTEVVIHAVNNSQAAGTAVGGSANGEVLQGDTVVAR